LRFAGSAPTARRRLVQSGEAVAVHLRKFGAVCMQVFEHLQVAARSGQVQARRPAPTTMADGMAGACDRLGQPSTRRPDAQFAVDDVDIKA